MRPAEVVIGMEVVRLDRDDPRAPWRMTVDVYEDGRMMRFQLTGRAYEQMERLATDATAERLDALDREYVARVQEHVDWLRREQVRVLHGDEGLALLDADD